MLYQKRMSFNEIKDVTGVGEQNLRRMVRRCISPDESGVVWGFRALIPNKHVKVYRLNPFHEERNESRKSGEFIQLLDKHPDIKDLIDDLYLGRNRRALEPIMKPKHIHKRFIDECRKKGIPLSDYPFNTRHMGSKALQRYLRRLAYDHFVSSSSREGHDAEQRAKHTGVGEQNHPSTLTPYQKVQFDAHRIDGMFAVKLTTPDGDEITRLLDRFWILCLIDVATRAVLGYSISLMKEYNASDVMQCIRNAVLPRQKKTLTISGLSYDSVGGFPSDVFPDIEWAIWDVICFDNAKAHLANLVQDRLHCLIGCSINMGPVDLPMRRGIIERFFKTLEEAGFHRLPNTTGSSPDDPRRTSPQENALKWEITYDHLKELIDVMISNYNGTPHGGIYHQTPLELLGKRMANGLLPRLLSEDKRSEVLFLQTTITRVVRGSLQSGKRPYVQYEGVEYRSDKLSNSSHLINAELTLHVNVDDLRTLKAFLPDGSEFGYLTAAGKWALTPHTLHMRKAINQLVLRKLIHYTTWDDPVFAYTNYLITKAAEKKRGAANKITHVNEVVNDKRKRVNEPQGQTEALEVAEKRNEALDKARELSNQEQAEMEIARYENMLGKFKTKSI